MKLIFVLAIILMSSGCASILHGNNDNISVNSLEKGTTIYVDGAARGLDSTVVNVKKGKPHLLRVEKEGCQAITAQTSESYDPTSLLGILLDFGLISMPIDFISGAAWKVSPTTYTLTPICKKDNE